MAQWPALDPSPEDVSVQLARLDLTVDDLLDAIRVGVGARRTATRHHPRSYGGWRDYGERVAAIRDTLIPRGWTSTEDEGVCLTVHPTGRLAIWTAIGDSGTGSARAVTTRRKRGKVTQQLVRDNAQLELALGLAPLPVLAAPAVPTWVLLVFMDEDEVHSELSLARHIDDGFIDQWIDRIPLPVIRLNDVLDEVTDEDPGAPEVDVEEL